MILASEQQPRHCRAKACSDWTFALPQPLRLNLSTPHLRHDPVREQHAHLVASESSPTCAVCASLRGGKAVSVGVICEDEPRALTLGCARLLASAPA